MTHRIVLPHCGTREFFLCLQGHIISKLQLQKWREKLSRGDQEGVDEGHPFQVLLRHKDMVSKERVDQLDVQVNLRTATENETAGQAGVDTAIFSVRPSVSSIH